MADLTGTGSALIQFGETGPKVDDANVDALVADLESVTVDAHVVASHLVSSASKLGRATPTVADLTSAIQTIYPESHLAGADVIKITLQDEGYRLLDSNFFSPADDHVKGSKKPLTGEPGKLDPLEVNWPDGSKYWWRLATLTINMGGQLILTMISRVADEAQQHKGPFKANRAQMTRAEFLKLVWGKIPEARFHSAQLDVKEPIDPIQVAATTPSSKDKTPAKKKKKAEKQVGVSGNYLSLTVRGAPMGARQAANVNIILNVARKEGAGEAATVAAIYAGIWESNLEEYSANAKYGGVLAGSVKTFPNFASAQGTHDEAVSFFRGGKGYHGPNNGGAIAWEQSGKTNPIEIAVRTEVPSSWPDNAYAKEADYPGDQAALLEAQSIVQQGGGAAAGGVTGGGSSTSTVEIVQPYFFQIGTSDNVNETDWDGSQRLSGEVNWRLFTDGPDVYYDSEMTLIRQKPAGTIHRNDPRLTNWGPSDWNSRNVATQFTMNLVCEPFQFRAGEVLILKGFGMDEGSTAKLPGRWLIQDVVRTSSLESQITLKQPERPKNEPAPQVVTKTIDVGSRASIADQTGGGATALSGKSRVSGHPELKPKISIVFNTILAQFPNIRITATTNGSHATHSYHYLGEAVDFVADNMDEIGRWIAKQMTPYLTEGIHNPTLSVKDGKTVDPSFWGAATWAEHVNHIHVAAAQ